MADRYWGENIFSEYNVSGVLAASLLFSALIRTLAAKATPKKYAFTPRCQTSDRKVVDPKFKMLKNFICRSSINCVRDIGNVRKQSSCYSSKSIASGCRLMFVQAGKSGKKAWGLFLAHLPAALPVGISQQPRVHLREQQHRFPCSRSSIDVYSE